MAGWMKMPLGMRLSLDTDHIVLDGEPAPIPPIMGTAPNFRLISIVA